MKTKLTWFDRLMMSITFAEAGVEEPDLADTGREKAGAPSHVDTRAKRAKWLEAGRAEPTSVHS